MDTSIIKSVASNLKQAIIDGAVSSCADSCTTIEFEGQRVMVNVYYAGEGRYFASVYVNDVDANGRRWLHPMDFWVYCASVDLTFANIYGSTYESPFTRLAKQAGQAERLASVDAITLPGRLGRSAAAKANLYREESAYWRRLDKKVHAWSVNQALVGNGPKARLAAKIADDLGGKSEFSESDSEHDISAYWRVSFEV